MTPRSRTRKSPASVRFTSALLLAALALASLSVAQTATTLHVFTGGSDGANPIANFTVDANGNLFSTASDGGDLSCGGGAGCGVIFEEAAPASSGGSWTFSTIYNFTGGSDGCCQTSTLAIDSKSRLYGVTLNGLPGGSVFQLAPPVVPGGPWQFNLLHTFKDPTTYGTWTPLLLDPTGSIFASSYYGGLPGCTYSDGCGSVVKLLPPATKGAAWTETALHQFTGGTDGGNPASILIAGSHGVLYGTAAVGGLVTSSCPLGCGLVYQLSPPPKSGGTWTETVLYTFQGGTDGANPYSLTTDKSGSLYGVVCCHGTANPFNVFKLIPPALGKTTWTRTYIHGFSNVIGGPSSMNMGSNGVLYGANFGEIDFSVGYVFQLTPPTTQGGLWTFTNFGDPGPSRNPNGAIFGPFGALYGTLEGGDSDFGSVFEIQP